MVTMITGIGNRRMRIPNEASTFFRERKENGLFI